MIRIHIIIGTLIKYFELNAPFVPYFFEKYEISFRIFLLQII
jgi:hypothetical protein